MDGKSATFLIICGLLLTGSQAIINGTFVADNSPLIKSLVSLQVDGKHLCGGVLVNGHSVMTTTLCYLFLFFDEPPNTVHSCNVSAVFGTNRLSSPAAKRVPLRLAVVWPDNFPEMAKSWYLTTTAYKSLPNHVVLLKLMDEVRETSDIKYARLSTSSAQVPLDGEQCELVGYGRYKHPDVNGVKRKKYTVDFSDRLRLARVEVDDDEGCYGTKWPHEYLLPPGTAYGHPSIFCAKQRFRNGEPLGIPCYGDLGSPLFCGTDDQSRYLAGVFMTSRNPCIDPKGHILVQRTVALRQWIERNNGP